MIRLTRGIELTIHADGQVAAGLPQKPALGQMPLILWVTLEGKIDPATGLLVNVSDISRGFRRALQQPLRIGRLEDLFDWSHRLLAETFPAFTVVRVVAEVHQKLKIAWNSKEPTMIQVTTTYELAASHRLCQPDWDAEKNAAAFGKCSNPAGHGHNYTVAITVAGAVNATTGQVTDTETIRTIVQKQIIERFDHKHLNTDTVEFRELIPTVENMATVFWDLLAGRFGAAQLTRVAVWETPNTYAEYFGPVAGPLRYSDMV